MSNTLRVAVREEGKYLTLRENIVFQLPSTNRLYSIKAGFVCDGATIPRPLWRLCHPFDGRVLRASIVHDALYSSMYMHICSREEADKIFLSLLLLPARKKSLFYRGVRLFGRYRYGNQPKHEPENFT